MQIEKVLAVIREANFRDDGFSGNCFTLAVAIQNTLLPKHSICVAANNRIFENSHRFIGHAAVMFSEDVFIDGMGLKDWDEFESWGELDQDDISYAALAGCSIEEWQELAIDASIFEVSQEELDNYLRYDLLTEFEKRLRDAAMKFSKSRTFGQTPF